MIRAFALPEMAKGEGCVPFLAGRSPGLPSCLDGEVSVRTFDFGATRRFFFGLSVTAGADLVLGVTLSLGGL